MQQHNILGVAGLGTRHSYGIRDTMMRLKPWQGKGLPIDWMEFEPFENWKARGATMVTWKDPTIFLCHSYGVAAVMGMIRSWENRGPKVPLIISFDPSQYVWMSWALRDSGGNAVPARPVQVHNFWQQGWPIGYQQLARESGSTSGITNEEVDSTHTGIDDLIYTQTKTLKMLKLHLNIKE